MAANPAMVESFRIDHKKLDAPSVRKAGRLCGPKGDIVTKFDLRLVKPNTSALPTAALHTLEHILATRLREILDDVIDLSPMGCRTGFYLALFGEREEAEIKSALIDSLKKALAAKWEDVPGVDEKSCGNYRDHSLHAAREFAKVFLEGLEK